jgi:hypothetical protein
MGSKKDSVFRFTDACYSLEGSDAEWLTQLSQRARPFIDHGHGVAAWQFCREEWTTPELPYGVEPTLGQEMWSAAPRFNDQELVTLFMGARASSATARLGIAHGIDQLDAGRGFAQFGIKDFQALTVWDGAGRGVVLAGGVNSVLRLSRQRLAHLERLGAHLLAGFRLRRALRQVDAVLDPSGSTLHAERDAREPDQREALKSAVKAYDKARSRRGPAQPEEALQSFEALVAGRWSIVQSFESDGRRYLLAVQNPPGSMAAAALSANESHALVLRAQGLPHKLIAYELGVPDTVSFQLVQQGMAKLGLMHEADLPLLFREQAAAALSQVGRG